MKIDNSVKSSGSVSDTRTRVSREYSSSTSAASSESRVQIDDFARNLDKLAPLVKNASVVDLGKVAEIKSAISQGQFKVDSEKVAEGLIQSVREMLAAQPRTA